MPTQLFVGPKAPSGKKTTVRGELISVMSLAVLPASLRLAGKVSFALREIDGKEAANSRQLVPGALRVSG